MPDSWPSAPRAEFIATAVGSWAAGTTPASIAPSAGPNSDRQQPMTAATATSWATLTTSHQIAAARLATASAYTASQASRIFLRSQRSASAPAGSPATSWAIASTPSTSPDSAGEPVTASTSSGNAIVDALNPASDRAWLPQSSR